MNIKSLILGVLFFVLAQTFAWFQSNGQFLWKFFKDNTFIIALFGIPISYFYIWATKYSFNALGTLWSSRFMGFGIGILIYTVLLSVFFGEGLDLKVLISIFLALVLLSIQIFWN